MNKKLLALLALATLALFVALPVAQASYHMPTHGQRYWYDDHYRHHGPIYASNIHVPAQRYYYYTPPRRININPHHTQALCQWQCGTASNRPYIVITNQHVSQRPGPTYANVHHQHRVVQTPQPAARSTTSTVYHTHHHHTSRQPTHHVHNHYW